MKIKYMGKFDGSEESLPKREHHPEGAVMFKEMEMDKLGVWMNVVAYVIILVLMVPLFFTSWFTISDPGFLLGMVASLLCSIPHEYLHAICFKETAYIYTNLKQGMLFVTGPESMRKGRFIFMSLFPNLVFGLVPYIVGWTIHNEFLAMMGCMSLGMGAGDYYNVFNAIRQMPKGALTYLNGFHSWWYIKK